MFLRNPAFHPGLMGFAQQRPARPPLGIQQAQAQQAPMGLGMAQQQAQAQQAQRYLAAGAPVGAGLNQYRTSDRTQKREISLAAESDLDRIFGGYRTDFNRMARRASALGRK